MKLSASVRFRFLFLFLVVGVATVACDRTGDSDLVLTPVFTDEDASLEEQRRALDQAVLDALKNAGSDLSLPHSIEHHFVADSQALADELSKRGAELGFTPQPSRTLPARVSSAADRFGIDLIRECLPVIEEITPDSVAMTELAEELQVDYEGWGCSVRTAEEKE